MKYKKHKVISAMTEDEVKLELSQLGIEIPVPKVWDTPEVVAAERKDPYFKDYYAAMDAGTPRYPTSNSTWTGLHMMLFKHGVVAYVKRIGRADLDRLAEEHNIVYSSWTQRTLKRPTIEKDVIAAIIKKAYDDAA